MQKNVVNELGAIGAGGYVVVYRITAKVMVHFSCIVIDYFKWTST